MNRRDFLQAATASTLTAVASLSAAEMRAEDKKDDPSGPPVTVGVIGLGDQGRAILTSLAKLGAGKAPVAAICDNFKSGVIMRRAGELAPSAATMDDYRKMLDDKRIQAVFVATPSHKHKQIVLDALQAGKHVYCEAPLASSIEDARAIAVAGQGAKTFLVPGLQVRWNAQAHHVHKFIKAGDVGAIVQGRGHWHKRDSWRKAASSPEREKELNWRLYSESSAGLIGEIGIHQIDTASRYLNALPVAVTGFSMLNTRLIPGNQDQKDDRDTPVAAQCILQYPNGETYYYDASLICSFENNNNGGVAQGYEVFYGSGATILMRDQRAWMFKESDANTKGWEGFARVDSFVVGKPEAGTGETLGKGIALVADATKQLARGLEPGKIGTDVSKTSLYQAIEAFVVSVSQNKKPEYTAQDGFQATVVALKANEAAVKKTRIELTPAMFALSDAADKSQVALK